MAIAMVATEVADVTVTVTEDTEGAEIAEDTEAAAEEDMEEEV